MNLESHRQPSDVKSLIHELMGDDDEEIQIDLEDEHNDVQDSVESVNVGDAISVGWLMIDTCPGEHSCPINEDGETDGKLVLFHNREQALQELKTAEKSKKLHYLLNKYDHGAVHYSVSGSKAYPDERWDVSHGCGIYYPYDEIQDEYKKLKRKVGVEKAKEAFIERTNALLDSYSDWCNGEVYGYVVKVIDVKTGEVISEDSCWGYVGSEYAEEEKREAIINAAARIAQERSQEPPYIETIHEGACDLPFETDMDGATQVVVGQTKEKTIVSVKYSELKKIALYVKTNGEDAVAVNDFKQEIENGRHYLPSLLHHAYRMELQTAIIEERAASFSHSECDVKKNKPKI